MKKLILSTLAVLAAMGLHAQLLKVESMERVRLPQGVRAEQAYSAPTVIPSPSPTSTAVSRLWTAAAAQPAQFPAQAL